MVIQGGELRPVRFEGLLAVQDIGAEFPGSDGVAQLRPCLKLPTVIFAVCKPCYGLSEG
jgi:hypothetical protein